MNNVPCVKTTGVHNCPLLTGSITYNNNNNQYLYSAFPKSMTKVKAPAIYCYCCDQEIITITLVQFFWFLVLNKFQIR